MGVQGVKVGEGGGDDQGAEESRGRLNAVTFRNTELLSDPQSQCANAPLPSDARAGITGEESRGLSTPGIAFNEKKMGRGHPGREKEGAGPCRGAVPGPRKSERAHRGDTEREEVPHCRFPGREGRAPVRRAGPVGTRERAGDRHREGKQLVQREPTLRERGAGARPPPGNLWNVSSGSPPGGAAGDQGQPIELHLRLSAPTDRRQPGLAGARAHRPARTPQTRRVPARGCGDGAESTRKWCGGPELGVRRS